jgi:phytoene dehydrogenase-like protein
MVTAMNNVIVIGAGHNGLACAWQLARSGRRVMVLEAAVEVGGGAVTRPFAPDFRVSACAHLLRSFPADLAESMQLQRHGLRFAATAMPTHALLADAPALNVDRLGPSDAAFLARVRGHAEILREMMGMTPPSLALADGASRSAMLKLGWHIRRRGREAMRELLRIAGMNVYDLLEDHVESAALKGALGFDAVLGAEHGPRAPGTVLTWLQRLAGQAQAGATGLAQPAGGLGAFTQAMAAAVRAAGAEIRTDARVQRILVENDRACGVLLASGERVDAGCVISNADPRTTFFDLLGTEHLDTGFVRRIRHHRASGLVAKLHLALDGLPAFRGVDPAALGGRLIVSPTLDTLERSFNAAKYRETPSEPVMEIVLPTVNDPSLAPAGQHVLSASVMAVPYHLGADPIGAREKLLRSVLAVLERHAPGIGKLVRASELLAPADLERAFGMTGGHWHHGALSFDQFFFNRPVPGAGRYRTPVDGLYLCGAGCHPGGDVMGVAGLNAAREVAAAVTRQPAMAAA